MWWWSWSAGGSPATAGSGPDVSGSRTKAQVSAVPTASNATSSQVESAIESGKKADAAQALQRVQPEIARGVARGVIHKNTAARRISRLSKRVAALG